MEIHDAFEELIQSSDFKKVAKQQDSAGSKYRVYIKRFKEGTLGTGAMVELLITHGYKVTANKVSKKKKA